MSLLQDCVMLTFTEEVMHKCLHFSCGDEDLNSFFTEDAFLYAEDMLGKTYCWVTKEKPYRIVALITLANDSIKAPSCHRVLVIKCKEIFLMQKEAEVTLPY